MKRIFKYLFAFIGLAIIWAVLVFFSTKQGWWHTAIASDGQTDAYITAVEEQLKSEFVGSFALAVMQDEKLEHELFHSVGAPINC